MTEANFYRIYKQQDNRYLKLAYNSNSLKELTSKFIGEKLKKINTSQSFIYYKGMGEEEIISLIKAEGLIIRTSNKPFKKLDKENLKWGCKREIKHEDKIFKCRSCGNKFKNSFCSEEDVGICKWCGGEEK
jgi:hypothetical protein